MNQSIGGQKLRFTCEVWRPSGNVTKVTKKLTNDINVVEAKYFPYLDLNMYFCTHCQKLQFKVHLKANQELKYLNRESTHTRCCIRAVPCRVFNCLAKLTSCTRKSMNSKMDELYPDHCRALEKAGLLPADIPKLKDILGEIKESDNDPGSRSKNPQNCKRQSFFCIGMSNVWRGKKSVSA